MVDARMPKRLTSWPQPLLPPEHEARPQGGRRTIGHDLVLKIIGFALVAGCHCRDVSK